jgi:hypothetical protein
LEALQTVHIDDDLGSAEVRRKARELTVSDIKKAAGAVARFTAVARAASKSG